MTRPAGSSSDCRSGPRRSVAGSCSRSPASWRRRTGSSRSGRHGPTSGRSGPPPSRRPCAIGSAALGEGSEGRLVSTTGRLARKPTRTAAGDLTLILERDGGGAVKVTADASSRIVVATLKVGTAYRIVGVVGQRASRSGALDGYRIWVRDRADLVRTPRPVPPAHRPHPDPRAHPRPPHRPWRSLTIARRSRSPTVMSPSKRS